MSPKKREVHKIEWGAEPTDDELLEMQSDDFLVGLIDEDLGEVTDRTLDLNLQDLHLRPMALRRALRARELQERSSNGHDNNFDDDSDDTDVDEF